MWPMGCSLLMTKLNFEMGQECSISSLSSTVICFHAGCITILLSLCWKEVDNPWSSGNMWPLRSICVALHHTLKIFSSPFDVNCEEVTYNCRWHPIFRRFEVQVSCHILYFYKNSMLQSKWFLNHLHSASSEYVWYYISLSTAALWNKTFQKYSVFMTVKLSLVRCAPSVNIFIWSGYYIKCFIYILWLWWI